MLRKGRYQSISVYELEAFELDQVHTINYGNYSEKYLPGDMVLILNNQQTFMKKEIFDKFFKPVRYAKILSTDLVLQNTSQ